MSNIFRIIIHGLFRKKAAPLYNGAAYFFVKHRIFDSGQPPNLVLQAGLEIPGIDINAIHKRNKQNTVDILSVEGRVLFPWLAGLCLFRRLADDLPDLFAGRLQKQKLDRRTGVRADAVKPCGQDLGIIENQAVPRPEKGRDLAEYVMLDRPAFPPKHEQPAAVARLERRLRDQLLGQVIVKIAFFHEKPQKLYLK